MAGCPYLWAPAHARWSGRFKHCIGTWNICINACCYSDTAVFCQYPSPHSTPCCLLLRLLCPIRRPCLSGGSFDAPGSHARDPWPGLWPPCMDRIGCIMPRIVTIPRGRVACGPFQARKEQGKGTAYQEAHQISDEGSSPRQSESCVASDCSNAPVAGPAVATTAKGCTCTLTY